MSHNDPGDVNTIFFSSPAKCWEEALPVGNGKLGGMVFGLPYTERIQLNEVHKFKGRTDFFKLFTRSIERHPAEL